MTPTNQKNKDNGNQITTNKEEEKKKSSNDRCNIF